VDVEYQSKERVHVHIYDADKVELQGQSRSDRFNATMLSRSTPFFCFSLFIS
jgi:hypothetical protein